MPAHSNPAANAPWLPALTVDPGVRIRLLCLPFAGGGASAYRGWRAHLPRWIEPLPVALPGREARAREPLVSDAVTLAGQIVAGVRPALDAPFALFGHSMGALLAFEVARALRRRGLPMPRVLVVSGVHAPHLPYPAPRIAALESSGFRRALRQLGGTPEIVLQHPDILDLYEPILRADAGLCEDYVHTDEAPLAVPIVGFGGADDPIVTEPMLEGWRQHGCRGFSLRMFPGDHFFLGPQVVPLLEQVTAALAASLGDARAISGDEPGGGGRG